MKKILLILLFSALLPVCAEPPQTYQIELLVFKHIDSETFASETWPDDPNFPDLKNALELEDDGFVQQNIQLLPPESLTMIKERQTIDEELGYEVLSHITWKQPVTSPKFSMPVHVFGGREFSGSHGLPRFLSSGRDAKAVQNIKDWELNGTIKISKSKFLNLQTNLVLSEPSNSLPSDGFSRFFGAPLKSFRLMQSRRMREDELHYLDHPLFGVLIKINIV